MTIDPSQADDERRRQMEERDFLLTSLRDLDREWEAGDIDEHDYHALRDDYTRRAAQAIRGVQSRLDEPVPVRRARRVLAVVTVVAVVAAASGWMVAAQSGQRLPGQSITGGIEDSTASLLSQARALNFQDPGVAIELYSSVLSVDPDNIEALTYRAWLIALIARQATDEVRRVAYEAARSGFERAIALDPSYADAHCFLGIVLFRFGADALGAKRELDECAANDPPAVVKGFVEAIVAEVELALADE